MHLKKQLSDRSSNTRNHLGYVSASSSGVKFEEISYKNLKKIIDEKLQTNKNYRCQIDPASTKTVLNNYKLLTLHFNPVYIYYFNSDVIVNTKNSAVFSLTGYPYTETLYNGKFSLYKNDLPEITKLSNLETINNLIALSNPRWHGYFHRLTESSLNLYTLLKFFKSSKKFFLQNKQIENIDFISDLFKPQHQISTSDKFILAKSVLTSNLLYSNDVTPYYAIDFKKDILDEICVDTQKKRSRKIYSTRNHLCKRPIANQYQIENYFQQIGYEIVDFDKMSFVEQIKLAHSASIIAGPHGANLANAFFANKGTKLLEIIPSGPEMGLRKNFRGYERIASQFELNYFKYTNTGEIDPQKECTIDLDQLSSFMRSYSL